jgi:peptidyl-prolyl cis-trans isomerase C
MVASFRSMVIGSLLMLLAGVVAAQVPAPVPVAGDMPPKADVKAATVNGQVIPELAVYRGLMRVAPAKRAEARAEVLNFLVDNAIIDQYLLQLDIKIEAKEVDAFVAKMKAEAETAKEDFSKLLDKLLLTEADLRRELTASLRWDKFVLKQGTEKELQAMFEKNTDMFNDSRVRARHILVGGPDPKAAELLTRTLAIKKQIEDEVKTALAKLPAGTDALEAEKAKAMAIDKAFSDAAAKESTCPSKAQGGDLGMFPRVGQMVEPFARVAFALKPYEMSDPVQTEFGYHLILAVDRKPGRDVKFADVKPFVQEVYGERLREAILTQYRGKSKVVLEETKK